VRMCYRQHPDSTIVCVLQDGSIATLVYMREHEVAAWSHHTLGGGAEALDIATNKSLADGSTETMLVVRVKDGNLQLWSVRPDVPEATVSGQCTMDGILTLSAVELSAYWTNAYKLAWTGDWKAVDAATGRILTARDAPEAGHTYLCGYTFGAELVTVRPEPPGGGTIQFEIKNAKDAEVRILNGGSWRAAPFGLADDAVYAQCVVAPPAVSGGNVTLDSSDHAILLTGRNSGDGRIQIKSDDPWPLSILSLSVNYEIQPLSNSEG